MFADDAAFGNGTIIGDSNVFGDGVKFGNNTVLGRDNTIGKPTHIGDEFTFGCRLTMDGLKVLKVMHMSNVDGSHRRLTLVFHTKGVRVYAGCFVGTSGEFWKKSIEEGKLLYAKMVRSVVRTMRAHIKDTGITGGWDELPPTSS